MARFPIFLADGSIILNRCGPDLTPMEARARILREVEHAIANPAMEAICALLVSDLIVAIREAEAHAPANDDGDFTPPPAARSAAPAERSAA